MPVRASFHSLLEDRWESVGSLICVGLDVDYQYIPTLVRVEANTKGESISQSILGFNKEIIDATADLVCCYKPQYAFYAAEGIDGLIALKQTINYIQESYPDIPVLLDAKRSDISTTAEKYAIEVFDYFAADAVTLNPYLGRDSCQPFIERRTKGAFFLCHTSNPGASDFQEVMVRVNGIISKELNGDESHIPLYQLIAFNIANYWNTYGNCGLVTGATFPEKLAAVRQIVGDMPLLIPGIGVQGGNIKLSVNAGKNSKGNGMIISSSRGIIYASSGADFALAARSKAQQLRDVVNSFL